MMASERVNRSCNNGLSVSDCADENVSAAISFCAETAGVFVMAIVIVSRGHFCGPVIHLLM